MSIENVAKAHSWFEQVWNERRVDLAGEWLTPESVGHLEFGDVVGIEPFQQYQAELFRAFPDLKIEMEATVAQDDNVVVRWRATGTHAGDGLGCRATHCPVELRGITWIRFRDGKMIEGWDAWNQGGLLQRLKLAEQEMESGADGGVD